MFIANFSNYVFDAANRGDTDPMNTIWWKTLYAEGLLWSRRALAL